MFSKIVSFSKIIPGYQLLDGHLLMRHDDGEPQKIKSEFSESILTYYLSKFINLLSYTEFQFSNKYSNYYKFIKILNKFYFLDFSTSKIFENNNDFQNLKFRAYPFKTNNTALIYFRDVQGEINNYEIFDFEQGEKRNTIIGQIKDYIDIKSNTIFFYHIPDINRQGYNGFFVFEAHSVSKKEICIGQNANWTIKINIADQVVGMFKDNLSFQKLIGHDNDYLYFSLNDGRIYEVNVLTGDYTIIHNEYSQIRYGQYLDTETKEIFGSENYILEVLDLRTRQKTKHNLKPLFEQHGMTGTKNLLYVDKKHLYYGDNGKGGILILERGSFQPVWYEKTKPVLDLQIDGDHMAVYHMGNHLTLYKRTDTLTEQEKRMALQLVEAQVTEEQQPKKIIRPGFKIEQLAPHQRNGVDMPTEVYERELDGFYHEGHILDLIEGMADLTHGILKMESIEVMPFEKSEEPKRKCHTSLLIKGKEYKLNFDMFYAGLENFDFLSAMNSLLKETGYEGGNVFCDVTEDAHFIRFVFVTPEKYAEMDQAGIVCHPFDADNY